jgi:hypothetical protein
MLFSQENIGHIIGIWWDNYGKSPFLFNKSTIQLLIYKRVQEGAPEEDSVRSVEIWLWLISMVD